MVHESQTDRCWTEQYYVAGDLVVVYEGTPKELGRRVPSWHLNTQGGHISTELARIRLRDGHNPGALGGTGPDLGMMRQLVLDSRLTLAGARWTRLRSASAGDAPERAG